MSGQSAGFGVGFPVADKTGERDLMPIVPLGAPSLVAHADRVGDTRLANVLSLVPNSFAPCATGLPLSTGPALSRIHGTP
jgi:hypothetical protein